LRGGRQNSGVCVLLEIGGARILLDCGWENGNTDPAEIVQLANELVTAGGVDAILLSHSDFHHVGALPIVLGRNGMQNVPVICTSPVRKFSQMLLYEFVLNQKMEAMTPHFEYDDIDLAFQTVTTVNYNQRTVIPDVRGIGDSEYRQVVTVTAIPSGRTIGGSIWRINCGPAEVLYCMDINLKRDIVVDAASLEQLPASPALMITEGACVSRSAVGASQKGRRAKDDSSVAFLNAVMETVRTGGNVVIPCESAGRILEVLQILGRHWIENKIGLDHLLFLSHMGRNVIELAQAHLEWVSDSLNRDFYNGKENPFELPIVKIISSTIALEKRFPGPKVVLATEMSMSYGFSKELLLKWGGDPRSRVIYFDRPDQNSLISTIQELLLKPPIIVNINRPVRVPLVGQELADFRAEEEIKRKEAEEEMLRQKRQHALAEFQVVQLDNELEDEEETQVSGMKRSASTAVPNFRDIVSKRLRTSAIAKFLNSSFVMFESKIPVIVKMDEYGMSNDDLVFRDIQSTESRYAIRDRGHLKQRLTQNALAGGLSSTQGETNADEGDDSAQNIKRPNALSLLNATGQSMMLPPTKSNPTKLIAIEERVQFTCEFKEFNLSGRLDFKAMRALIQKVSPVRLLVVRGSDSDCDQLVKFTESVSIQAFSPRNRRSVVFDVFTERLKLQIPRTLIPTNLQIVRPAGIASSGIGSNAMSSLSAAGGTGDAAAHCTICVLRGEVSISETGGVGQEGSRIVKYLGSKDKGKIANEPSEDETTDEDADNVVTGLLPKDDIPIGVVSLGEVTMGQLKQLLEAAAIKTEFKLTVAGGILVCADQVIIRKDNNNFSIEGPPVKAFFEARRILYNQFAFL
jgi:cleavage and polyadenylation specificity factor subunit 2